MPQKPALLHATLSSSAGGRRQIVCESYYRKLDLFNSKGWLVLAAPGLKELVIATMEGNVVCFPLMAWMWEEF
ncbi:hypothetical protein DSW25_02440 [Sulfitobacter donghicola DSW-25 = KCTC 12864 = JCM 14565]|uniref:Uncharacterized protein n=1 Tax=Sulfitobacter donghicola DSW-25 = KCTC 12864 = JCM 14565 TaxID=1300350 RepID=A0A073INE4_9RHOB|nr:hypothetical protein DSW25_02440 [Sulfitobacter donghicola DSW-25 = KCTC 12864 = JCM 14565]